VTSPQLASLPLYAPLSNRNESVLKDSRLINGFVEKGQGESGQDVWIYKRPGLKVSATAAGTGLGVFNWKNDIYSIFNGHLYKNGVDKGAVDTTSSYTFTSCLGATPKLFLKNKAKAYNYDDGGGLVAVTDVNYPATTVRGCVYLDGTTYVMEPSAVIDGCNFNDPTTWDPLNKVSVQIEPDAPQCLDKQLVYAIAIKTIETEVFYDAGNGTGSPLGPVQGSKIGVGARSAESVVRCGDDLAWVGTTREGAVQVMFMSKVHGEAISTPSVERLLEHVDFSVTYAWAARVSGHRYYVVTSKNSNLTLAFDLSAGAWYIWTDANGNYLPIVSSTYDSGANSILQHESNGKLYTFDSTNFGDDGSVFTVSVFTANYDGGLRSKKTCSTVDVIADEISTNVAVSWSDDDYQTFSTPQSVNLNQERVMFQDGSSFRKRAYCITHTDNTFLRIKALNIMASAGTF
jgi:hypothetical protein